MVGGCGVIGEGDHSIDDMVEPLTWTGAERITRYEDADLSLRSVTHTGPEEGDPGRAPGRDAFVWIWGNVLGFERDGRYRPRDPDVDGPPTAYCARLYDEHGLEFVRGLNGDFVGLVHDRERRTVSVFTDRLGSWRLYFTELDDGSVVFAPHIRALGRYPPVDLAFDEAYLVQHLSDGGGPYGVKTPVEGVEVFPPGAITTCDLATATISREVYWTPTFEDVDAPLSDYVDAFVERFQASIDERTRDRSKRYGVLLSGGADSRLVLAALDDDLDVTAYHMADWMSREARVAERVAMAADVEFRFLRRDAGYFDRMLDRTPRMWNFNQLFTQAWADGFIDEIRSEVDVLLTGHFCDTMFKGWFVPHRTVGIGPLGRLALPLELPIESIEGYVDELDPEPYPYVDTDVDLRSVVAENVSERGGGVRSYGLEFESLRDFVLGVNQFPATTDSFFRRSLREHLELQMPVLDNRLVDLWTTMPARYQLREDLIRSAVARVDAELAAIPDAGSGVPMRYPTVLHRAGAIPMDRLARLSPFEALPAEDVNQSPWGDHAELIRTRSFVEDAILEAEDLIRSLSFLDWETVLECYRDHLDGADNTRQLYKLLTFVESPLVLAIADTATAQPGDGDRPDALGRGR